MRTTKMLALVLGLGLFGCPSEWKIHGGPAECMTMCQGWGMRMVGMVGVGSQDRGGGGATACVCEVPTTGGEVSSGATGVSASTGAVAVMLAEEARQQQERQE